MKMDENMPKVQVANRLHVLYFLYLSWLGTIPTAKKHSILTAHFDMHALYFLLRYYIFFILFVKVLSHIHSFWLLPGDDHFRFLDWILSIFTVSWWPDKIRPGKCCWSCNSGSNPVQSFHPASRVSSLAPARIVLPDEVQHGRLAGVELPGRLFVYLVGLVVLLHEFGMKSGLFGTWVLKFCIKRLLYSLARQVEKKVL